MQYKEQDSLRATLEAIKRENQPYYIYYIQDPDFPFRPAVDHLFSDLGFGGIQTIYESELNAYLYGEHNGMEDNAAKHWIDSIKISDPSQLYIGLAYNSVPERMRKRIDSTLNGVYVDPIFRWFEDTTLPKGGAIYHIK